MFDSLKNIKGYFLINCSLVNVNGFYCNHNWFDDQFKR